jgi:heme/copper-type cytochrome/quinol oxidase subunit 4
VRVTQSPARRRFLEFLVSVAALHVVAIALFYFLDMSHASPARQRMFAWVWMGATVLVVFVGLQRLKRARRRRPVARQ